MRGSLANPRSAARAAAISRVRQYSVPAPNSRDLWLAWIFTQEGKNILLPISGSLIVSSVELALSAALNGIGVARTTLDLVRSSLKAGQLERILQDWDTEIDGFFICYQPGQIPAYLKAFIAFMKAHRPHRLRPASNARQ